MNLVHFLFVNYCCLCFLQTGNGLIIATFSCKFCTFHLLFNSTFSILDFHRLYANFPHFLMSSAAFFIWAVYIKNVIFIPMCAHYLLIFFLQVSHLDVMKWESCCNPFYIVLRPILQRLVSFFKTLFSYISSAIKSLDYFWPILGIFSSILLHFH